MQCPLYWLTVNYEKNILGPSSQNTLFLVYGWPKCFITGQPENILFEIWAVPLTFIIRKCTCYAVLIPPLPPDNTFPQPLSDCSFTESTHISFKRIYHAFHHFSPMILQHTNDKLQASDTTTPHLFPSVTFSTSLSNFALVSWNFSSSQSWSVQLSTDFPIASYQFDHTSKVLKPHGKRDQSNLLSFYTQKS